MKTNWTKWMYMLICLMTWVSCKEETVVEDINFSLNTESLDFGKDCSSLSFDIINEGEVPFDWTLDGLEDNDCLQACPASGSLQAGRAMPVTLHLLRKEMAADIDGVLFVKAGDRSVPLKVKADKKPARYIEANTDTLVLDVDDSIQLTLRSHHGETNYELIAEGDYSWARFSKTMGTVPSYNINDTESIETITVSADRTGLEAGNYIFTLIVRSDLGDMRIPVTMTVKKPRTGIWSVEDLMAFRDARNAGDVVDKWMDNKGVITLHTDIDLTDEVWLPIAKLQEGETFDGNGHTVRINKISVGKDEIMWGLFLSNSGVIQNLYINVFYRTGKYNNIGTVVYGNSGKVINCHVTVQKDSEFTAETWFGGLVNQNFGRIENCTARGCVKIYGVSGGICCRNYGFISGCTNNLEMSGKGSDTGGITGYNEVVARYKDSGQVQDCVNNAKINLDNRSYRGCGGVIGLFCSGKVSDCVNNGTVNAAGNTMKVGGIAGCAALLCTGQTVQGTRIFSHCSNNGDVKGDTEAVGCIVGDLGGVESKIEGCSYGGHVNGIPGSIQNAVGSDKRFE